MGGADCQKGSIFWVVVKNKKQSCTDTEFVGLVWFNNIRVEREIRRKLKRCTANRKLRFSLKIV